MSFLSKIYLYINCCQKKDVIIKITCNIQNFLKFFLLINYFERARSQLYRINKKNRYIYILKRSLNTDQLLQHFLVWHTLKNLDNFTIEAMNIKLFFFMGFSRTIFLVISLLVSIGPFLCNGYFSLKSLTQI